MGVSDTTEKDWEEHYKEVLETKTSNMGEYLESNINQMIMDMVRKETELREKALAEIFSENDFVVGSPILKAKLEDAFKGMRVSYSPYVEENTIIMIKKAMLNPHLVPMDFND